MGAAGRGLRSLYAGSAGRHSCVRVCTRCSPPAVRGGPVARGVRGRALSPLRLPSSWELSGPATHVLWARVCGYGVQRCPRGPYSLCSSGAGSLGFAARVSVVGGVWCQALSLPRSPALWAGRPSPPATCCGRGRAGLAARHCPLGLHALWELRAARVVGGRPRQVWPANIVRGVWCQTLSLPEQAHPLGRVAGVSRPV